MLFLTFVLLNDGQSRRKLTTFDTVNCLVKARLIRPSFPVKPVDSDNVNSLRLLIDDDRLGRLVPVTFPI